MLGPAQNTASMNEAERLRHALIAAEERLWKAETALREKSFECEKLSFQLQSVSFGQSQLNQSIPWTRARVVRAVESRTAASQRYGKRQHHNAAFELSSSPMVTVDPSKNARERKTSNHQPNKYSGSKGKAGFADVKGKQLVEKMSSAEKKLINISTKCNPVCVDDYTLERVKVDSFANRVHLMRAPENSNQVTIKTRKRRNKT